jgi:xylan 1,4-beta-xylosidase
MRTIALILILLTTTFSFGTIPDSAPKPEEIKAALAAHDRTIHVKDGFIRDPYIVKAPDGFFYFTGTTQISTRKELPEDKYTSGKIGYEVQVWKTKDFIHWKSLGVIYSLKDGFWYTAKPENFKTGEGLRWRLWAPELYFINGRFVVISTSPSPVSLGNISVAQGLKPKGPWANPMGDKISRIHDPSLFQDDDRTWWMIWGLGPATIAPLKTDLSGYASEPINIGSAGEFKDVGYEGFLMRKILGKYVLFGTAWSTGKGRKGTYNLYYATADKITGPYGERKFAGRFLGHGTTLQDSAGRWWRTAFFNGNVPPLSREGIQTKELSDNAYTLNEQGLNLVPLDVNMEGNELVIRATDPDYSVPGPEELQKFRTK